MIRLEDVLEIHQALVGKFGGINGVRDQKGMESAIERPFGGFGNTAFYPSAEEKAAAIVESIVKNHPFLDGNKRTGYALMRLTLLAYSKDIRASQQEKHDLIISIASSQFEYSQILSWIRERIIPAT